MKIILFICGIASIASGSNITECEAPSWPLKICEISTMKTSFLELCSQHDNLTVQMCNTFMMASRTRNQSLLLSLIKDINDNKTALFAHQLHLEFFTKMLELIAEDLTNIKSNDIAEITKLLDTFLRIASAKWLEMKKHFDIPKRITTAFRHILANAEAIEMNSYKRMAILKMKLDEHVQGAVATLTPKVHFPGILRNISQNENLEALTNNDVVIILPKDIYRITHENASLIFEFYKSKDLFVVDDHKEDVVQTLFPGLEDEDETEPLNAMAASFLIIVNGSYIDVAFKNNPITIKFKYTNEKKDDHYGCLAWTEEKNWEPERTCVFQEKKDKYIICACDKTGTFTFTNDLDHYLEQHDANLDIIEHIGSSISLPALAVNIITYIRFKEWRKGLHHKTVVNLSFALFGDIIAMLNIDDFRTWKPGCIPLVAIQHFFLLAVIAWILIEGIILYMEVSHKHYARFMKIAFTLGWGVPLVTVVSIASVDYNLYYLNHHDCWMKHSVYVFGFIVPAVFVLVVNLILIAVIMRKVCCANGNAKMKAHLPPHCKTTYLAMTLFVITWTFFWVAVFEKEVTMWYLHAALYSLEGFLVFFLNVIAEPHTFKRLWCKGINKEKATTEKQDTDEEEKDIEVVG